MTTTIEAPIPQGYLTKEHRELQSLAEDFAMKEVLTIAHELDPDSAPIPDELRQKVADVGSFGIPTPEECGGLGLGAFEYCMIAEELLRAWMSVASLMARGNGLVGGFTGVRMKQLLPKGASGEYLGAFALSEIRPAPTSPISAAGLPVTGTTGSSTAAKCGAPLPTRRTT